MQETPFKSFYRHLSASPRSQRDALMCKTIPIPPRGQAWLSPRCSRHWSCPSHTQSLLWICASFWEGAAPHPAWDAGKQGPLGEVCSCFAPLARTASNFPGQGCAVIVVFCPWLPGLWDTRETPFSSHPPPSASILFFFLISGKNS